MNFITTDSTKEGTKALADKISFHLAQGKKVLWLVPGGSNVPITAAALDLVRKATGPALLAGLTIAQADERYGPVGHADSNWAQLKATKVNLEGIRTMPILVDDSPLADTVRRYGVEIEKVLPTVDLIVGQFGMGADGHIAGILPHTPGVTSAGVATGYEGKPFTRVSLAFPTLRKINIAYMFVSYGSKKDAIDRLHENNVPLDDQPAQILKDIAEVYIYID